MVLCDTSPPSSGSAGFPNKVAIHWPQHLVSQFIGLLCCEQYELGLGNKFWRSQPGGLPASGQLAPIGEY